MKKSSLKAVVVLVVICMLTAALMAAVNMLTAPKIAAAQAAAEQEALSAVLPQNSGFDKYEGELPDGIVAMYTDKGGAGSVAMLEACGYDSSKPMSVAVGFNSQGEILAVKIISAQGETSGIGSRVTGEDFLSQFTGKSYANINEVDAISGATISSSALIEAVRAAAELMMPDGR